MLICSLTAANQLTSHPTESKLRRSVVQGFFSFGQALIWGAQISHVHNDVCLDSLGSGEPFDDCFRRFRHRLAAHPIQLVSHR